MNKLHTKQRARRKRQIELDRLDSAFLYETQYNYRRLKFRAQKKASKRLVDETLNRLWNVRELFFLASKTSTTAAINTHMKEVRSSLITQFDNAIEKQHPLWYIKHIIDSKQKLINEQYRNCGVLLSKMRAKRKRRLSA